MAKFYSQDLCTKWQNFIPRTFVLNRKKTKLKKITPEEEERKKERRKKQELEFAEDFGELKKL